jgi:hypothetical protein
LFVRHRAPEDECQPTGPRANLRPNAKLWQVCVVVSSFPPIGNYLTSAVWHLASVVAVQRCIRRWCKLEVTDPKPK